MKIRISFKTILFFLMVFGSCKKTEVVWDDHNVSGSVDNIPEYARLLNTLVVEYTDSFILVTQGKGLTEKGGNHNNELFKLVFLRGDKIVYEPEKDWQAIHIDEVNYVVQEMQYFQQGFSANYQGESGKCIYKKTYYWSQLKVFDISSCEIISEKTFKHQEIVGLPTSISIFDCDENDQIFISDSAIYAYIDSISVANF